ncbi:response regulator [Sciscionella sediminilitoris]|uniref:response regulator n=1 Tax=Sciscionella sediminilitoris TaxID=1445613 RepID=UPI0004DF91F7|nr:response regulator [Sciscionella sp. SE31]
MIRVLVVDDDFRVAGLHAEFTASVAGFHVEGVAHSAAQARARIAETRPDLLLVDIYLPDGSGLELVRAHQGDTIVASAADDADTVHAALRAGAVGYLIKPFAAEALTARLRGYRAFHEQLTGPRLGQQDVDAALRSLHAGEPSPRRACSATTGLVAELLERAGAALSAAEVARELGIARATAQRHLGSLTEQGTVRMGLRYGSTGRPEHEYTWTGAHG